MPHKQLVRRLYDEVFTAGRLDAVDELVSAHAVDHEEFEGATGDARADLKAFVALLREAVPDLSVEIEDLIEEGDRVVARVTMRGTNAGPFLGNPPSGGEFALPVIDIMRFEAGRMVEHWGASDSALLTQQLGAPVG